MPKYAVTIDTMGVAMALIAARADDGSVRLIVRRATVNVPLKPAMPRPTAMTPYRHRARRFFPWSGPVRSATLPAGDADWFGLLMVVPPVTVDVTPPCGSTTALT